MFSFLFMLIGIIFVLCYLYHFIIDTLTIFNELSDSGKLDGLYLSIVKKKQKYNKEYFKAPFKGFKEIVIDIIKYIRGWVEKETY